jgi:hypothetical protein
MIHCLLENEDKGECLLVAGKDNPQWEVLRE